MSFQDILISLYRVHLFFSHTTREPKEREDDIKDVVYTEVTCCRGINRENKKINVI